MKLPPKDLGRALEASPLLLFEVARSGSIDELVRCLSALRPQDERRRRLVLSALASRDLSDGDLVKLAEALDEIERLFIRRDCRSVSAERLEAAGFAEDGTQAWKKTLEPELDPVEIPSDPGRIGDARRAF